jgi:hypothetical protein
VLLGDRKLKLLDREESLLDHDRAELAPRSSVCRFHVRVYRHNRRATQGLAFASAGEKARVDTCTHCGGELPASAVFCPSCGRRTDAPSVVRDVPIDVQHAEPRYFGLGPPVFVFSLGVGLLVLGIVLLVLDAFAVGVIAIVLAVCLLPTFLAGARRWPETRIARAGISTADRVSDEAEVAVTSIATWSRAGRDTVRLRKEQFGLRRERDSKIRELGVSVYEEDGRADELKAEAKELDERIAASERELARAIAGARRGFRKGRASVAATEVIPSSPLAGEDPEHEGEPVDADDVGLDPEGEDGGEGRTEPGSAPEHDPEQRDVPRDEREHAE